MGVRGLIQTTPQDAFTRMAAQVNSIVRELKELKSIVRRDCLKARGYELEYRQLPTPGLYLVNKRDNDPNFGTATLIGP